MPIVLLAIVIFMIIGAVSHRVRWPQTAMIAVTAATLAVIQLTLPRFL